MRTRDDPTSLIVEHFLMHWHGIPFTSARHDVHPALPVLGLMAWIIATAFAYGIGNLEHAAEGRPVVAAVLYRRHLRVPEQPHAEYESTSDKPFLLLDLSS